MKVTGYMVMLVGFAMAAYCGIAAVTESQLPPAEGATPGMGVMVALPAAFAVFAVAVGAGLVAFGGRGVIRSQDPAVRN
jgi:hypothetical protein